MESVFWAIVFLIIAGSVAVLISIGVTSARENNQCKAYCYPAKFETEANHCVCLEPTKMIELEELK